MPKFRHGSTLPPFWIEVFLTLNACAMHIVHLETVNISMSAFANTAGSAKSLEASQRDIFYI